MLDGKRLLLAGYGREGRSSHRLLQTLCPDASVSVACDDKEAVGMLAQEPPFDLVLKSPGIPMSLLRPHVDLSRVSSQSDIFLQLYADRTVGVSGTKGKSTTTALIGHILSRSLPAPRRVLVAGNMGIPLFDIIPQMDDHTVVVAELSCHQLQGIHRAPHIGVLLNLYQEHLDHYDGYRDYQMAKMQLMLRQRPGDVCFYCSDSADLAALVGEVQAQVRSEVLPYSAAEAAADVSAQWPSVLAGAHNRTNIFVARRVAQRFGVDDAACAAAVASFEGLPHRLQRVGTWHGVTFYNDSISTIPEATIAALQALPDVDSLILGGYDRGIDYSPIVDYLAAHDAVRNVVFVGAAGRRMAGALSACDVQRRSFVCDDYRAIVEWCYAHTAPGRICLLSPAAASYDAFANFEQRGETFCHWVKVVGESALQTVHHAL
ncbi:MAG: UDP-N-acetylmuramoylalanine--D-glutamate ligase [bacterium P3]|nr:MAG: UDP-N-acetylmuramoylalanine--D-glutamate ligase [bacterium P3]KWW41968.1 MAG: UDP-N-acetylmuramoylalanine--D-glutamate ligase [bacterium F083]